MECSAVDDRSDSNRSRLTMRSMARLTGLVGLLAAAGTASGQGRGGGRGRGGGQPGGGGPDIRSRMELFSDALSLTGGRDESLTTGLTINFLRRPGAAALLAEARVLRRGRLPFAEVWIRAEGAEEPCAHVTSTWAAVAPPRG